MLVSICRSWSNWYSNVLKTQCFWSDKVKSATWSLTWLVFVPGILLGAYVFIWLFFLFIYFLKRPVIIDWHSSLMSPLQQKKKKNAPNILQPFTWAHSQSSSVPIQDSRFKITLFISGEICLGHRLPQACKKILNTKCIAQKGTHILQSVSHSYIKHNTSKLCQGFRFSVWRKRSLLNNNIKF